MPEGGGRKDLEILPDDVDAVLAEGAHPGHGQEFEAGARRGPEPDLPLPVGLGQGRPAEGREVIEDLRADEDALGEGAQLEHGAGIEQRVGQRAFPGALEHFPERGARGIGNRQAEGETIELGLGQRIGPFHLDRVLRAAEREGFRQGVRRPAQRDLLLLHRLEEGGLGLRGRSVDLVGEDEVAEDRPLPEAEREGPAVLLLEDLGPGHVRGHQVGGALDPGEAEPEASRQPLDEARLPETGKPLEEDVLAGEDREEKGFEDLLAGADPDLPERVEEGLDRGPEFARPELEGLGLRARGSPKLLSHPRSLSGEREGRDLRAARSVNSGKPRVRVARMPGFPSFRRAAALAVLVLEAGCGGLPPDPAAFAARFPEGGGRSPEPEEDRVLERIEADLESGRVESAAEAAGELARAAPRLAKAHALLGRCLLALARRRSDPPDLDLMRRAEGEFLAAVALAPKDPALYGLLGSFYEADGHVEAALAAYDRALEGAAFDLRALRGAARLAVASGRERAAARYLESLRAATRRLGIPLPAEALFLDARVDLVLFEARDQTEAARRTYLERAVRSFREIRARFPEDPRGPLGLAHSLCLRAMGEGRLPKEDRDEIRLLFLEAARLAPADPLPRYDLARFLESPLVGDEFAAIQQYRAALDRDPRHLPSRLNLARLLWRRGEREEARAIWRAALPELEGSERRRVRALLSRTPSAKPARGPSR